VITGLDLPDGSWWDWDVVGWDRRELRLAAGPDLAHAHHLEVVFTAPGYVCCPAEFSDPVFRSPSADEVAMVTRFLDAEPGVLVAFDAEGAATTLPGLIAADAVRIDRGTVYRYPAPGGRLAPWVTRPG
jgi:hypothetical protein